MLWSTIRADPMSHVDASRGSGVAFWVRVIGMAVVSPAVHVVICFRISHVLGRHLLTRPLAHLVRSLTGVRGGTEIHPDAQIGPALLRINAPQATAGWSAASADVEPA
jgi:serine O-acetyltransferase